MNIVTGPLVSVVIPTYNHAHFLGRALQSVLDQTYANWEMIVIDNHSRDKTNEVVESFSDPRIHLLNIHNHGVIAASRNMGIRESRGEWLAFLDSDDCWYPKRLETIMAATDTDNSNDVLCNDELMVNIETGVKRLSRCGPYQKDFYKALLIEGNRLSPSATVVRREFLVRHGLAFDESREYITVEDYDLWLNLARTGARFKFINEVLGEYVIHGSNSSVRLSRHLENCGILLHDHVFKVQQFYSDTEGLWRLVLSRLRLMQAKQLFAGSQLWQALMLVIESLISSPRGTIIYLLLKSKKRLRK